MKRPTRKPGTTTRKLVADLNTTKGDEQWAVIRSNSTSSSDQLLRVNMPCHWFGTQQLLHVSLPGKNGKWTMYPWDWDKTWDSTTASGNEVFFDMPVTFEGR